MKSNIQTALIVVLLGYLLTKDLLMPSPQDKLVEYWENKNFKTDSITLDIDYSKIPKPTYDYKVPPAKVYNYTNTIIKNVSVTVNDSLISVIDSLTGKIDSISLEYLKISPNSAKLLYGEFTLDTIKLDLLNISGNTQTIVYPVNYSRFSYQYQNNEFRANKNSQLSPKSFSLSPVFYLLGGYSLLQTSPYVGLEITTNPLSRLRIHTTSFVLIRQSPYFNLNIGVGYRLNYGQKKTN